MPDNPNWLSVEQRDKMRERFGTPGYSDSVWVSDLLDSHAEADRREAELRVDRQRLLYLLDQLSPSMYSDHGKYALDQIAKQMRNVRSGDQLTAAIETIDAAMKKGTPDVRI